MTLFIDERGYIKFNHVKIFRKDESGNIYFYDRRHSLETQPLKLYEFSNFIQQLLDEHKTLYPTETNLSHGISTSE